ncbi:Vacuolar protein-sorting-associated protein 27 [Malassezia brasiliensis]|uniref:Vacuolar protein sorting-associated protein 27 n=1 Tax=Malassezia brasiliensis TaxID=1821822 RepID=A0AAF0IPR4_9BASI|nr:Vacuolar protein-sorting-associated protein 27 [Malassezia brasiliensis]
MVGFWASRESRAFEAAVAKATSPMIPAGHEDIAQNLEVCDQVRAKAVPPHEAARVLQQRLTDPNANVQILTLGLTDLCIKNGGNAFLAEVASPTFMDAYALHLRRASSPEVRAKMLRCLQDWRFFAQTRPEEWGYIEETAARLEREGLPFPTPDPNAVAAARAFSETLSAPPWQDNAVCTKCRTEFSTFLRKHHCRNCGRVFCYQCSGKTMPLPWYGIGQDVRVCDGCFARKKPYTATSAAAAPPRPARTPAAASARSEDADLARAIALSLQDAAPNAAREAPPATGVTAGRVAEGTDDDDDPDLAAAIAASLRDLPPEPIAREAPASLPAPSSVPAPARSIAGDSNLPASSGAPLRPSLELDVRDIDNVLTFSQTVLQPHAPWKARVAQQGMPRPVQNMYEKAATSRVRVVRNLDEGTRRLRDLAAMHDQLSEAVRMYDRLLDAQIGEPRGTVQDAPTRAPRAPAEMPPMPPYASRAPADLYAAERHATRYAPSAPSAPSYAPSAPGTLYAPSAPSAPLEDGPSAPYAPSAPPETASMPSAPALSMPSAPTHVPSAPPSLPGPERMHDTPPAYAEPVPPYVHAGSRAPPAERDEPLLIDL